MPFGYALLVATKEDYIMVLNFTDPFLTTRVLGLKGYFIDFIDFLKPKKGHQAIPHTTFEEMRIQSLLMLLLLVYRKKTSTLNWRKAY